MTAVANSIFTASQFNQYVRDNLNETAPAKAVNAGGYFVATGVNAIAERTAGGDLINAAEDTASTTFTDLATPGPAVTKTTGTSAFVAVYGLVSNNTAGFSALMSFDVTGATAVTASDTRAVTYQPPSVAAARSIRASAVTLLDGLTPGSNIFTAKYRVTGGTGSFNNRRIAVLPL
jgi:hypothetical protein